MNRALNKSVPFSLRRQWVPSALAGDRAVRQAQWSEAIAVGSERFTQGVKERLGVAATHREVVRAEDSYAVRERLTPYTGDFGGEMVPLSSENRLFWNN